MISHLYPFSFRKWFKWTKQKTLNQGGATFILGNCIYLILSKKLNLVTNFAFFWIQFFLSVECLAYSKLHVV